MVSSCERLLGTMSPCCKKIKQSKTILMVYMKATRQFHHFNLFFVILNHIFNNSFSKLYFWYWVKQIGVFRFNREMVIKFYIRFIPNPESEKKIKALRIKNHYSYVFSKHFWKIFQFSISLWCFCGCCKNLFCWNGNTCKMTVLIIFLLFAMKSEML